MSTLVQLFTNIANAIREKKGTEGLIDAENFPQEIASIPTGTTPTGVIDIVENGLINVSDYATANVNVQSFTVPDGMKFGYSKFNSIDSLDISAVTDMSNMFYSCQYLVSALNLDTSNVTNMRETFNGCRNLTIISNFNTDKVTDMSGMFTRLL